MGRLIRREAFGSSCSTASVRPEAQPPAGGKGVALPLAPAPPSSAALASTWAWRHLGTWENLLKEEMLCRRYLG